MKIISHRGGAGFSTENTASAIKTSLQYNIDAIEIDVRYTKDNFPILIHDFTTKRIADKTLVVHESTLADLKSLTLNNGEKLLTLEEALIIIDGRVPIYLDVKDCSTVRSLTKTLNNFPETTFVLSGRIYHFMQAVAREHGNVGFLVQSLLNPYDVVRTAQRLDATGIAINAWLLNPLTYWTAKRAKLQICTYTINNPVLMWFIGKLYPDVWVNTNIPNRYVSKQSSKRK